MALTETETKLLEGIRGNLKWGDMNLIAEKSGFTREYVTKVLSLNNDDFNKDIITAAVNLISQREENAKKLLTKLSTAINSEDNINTQEPIMQAH